MAECVDQRQCVGADCAAGGWRSRSVSSVNGDGDGSGGDEHPVAAVVDLASAQAHQLRNPDNDSVETGHNDTENHHQAAATDDDLSAEVFDHHIGEADNHYNTVTDLPLVGPNIEQDRQEMRNDKLFRLRSTRTAGVVVSMVAAVALAGCGTTTDRDPDVEVPGSGEPVPTLALVASDHESNPLQEWAQARAGKYGIPVRALQAYGFATVLLAKTQPGCHLGWSTLAGIAQIESDHGRHRGAEIATDGQVRPPIRGAPLDGTNGNARIIDPAGTKRSGHTVFAAAAGPFQFIPDTWARWGIRAGADRATVISLLQGQATANSADLNGNPDDIDDAAVAAARYLCASGRDLSTAAGWRKAIFAYNHSDTYVRQVHTAASGYAK